MFGKNMNTFWGESIRVFLKYDVLIFNNMERKDVLNTVLLYIQVSFRFVKN